jgi:hypothetical protein
MQTQSGFVYALGFILASIGILKWLTNDEEKVIVLNAVNVAFPPILVSKIVFWKRFLD